MLELITTANEDDVLLLETGVDKAGAIVLMIPEEPNDVNTSASVVVQEGIRVDDVYAPVFIGAHDELLLKTVDVDVAILVCTGGEACVLLAVLDDAAAGDFGATGVFLAGLVT